MTFRVEYTKDNIKQFAIVSSLDLAIEKARELGVFVSIKNKNFELVGMFGANGIQNGKLPSGEDYTWSKKARHRK